MIALSRAVGVALLPSAKAFLSVSVDQIMMILSGMAHIWRLTDILILMITILSVFKFRTTKDNYNIKFEFKQTKDVKPN